MILFFRKLIPLITLWLCAACSSLPKGEPGPQAEALAQRMLKAADYEKWQAVQAIEFVFRGDDRIFWDKKRKLVEWTDKKKLVQFSELTGKSICYEEDRRVNDECGEMTQKAVKRFYNNTFWINPAYHVMAPGTTRGLVSDEGDKLLVSYASGGATPGDSYLFSLDDEGKIADMRMWVSVLAVKGIKASFSDYQTFSPGIKIALKHKVGGLASVDLSDLKIFVAYPEADGKDRFQGLLEISGGPGSESLNRKK